MQDFHDLKTITTVFLILLGSKQVLCGLFQNLFIDSIPCLLNMVMNFILLERLISDIHFYLSTLPILLFIHHSCSLSYKYKQLHVMSRR